MSERERLFARLKEVPFLEPYPSHANFILAKVGWDGGEWGISGCRVVQQVGRDGGVESRSVWSAGARRRRGKTVRLERRTRDHGRDAP